MKGQNAPPELKELEKQVRDTGTLTYTREDARRKGTMLGHTLRDQIRARKDLLAQRYTPHPIVYEALLMRLSREGNVLVAEVAGSALIALRERELE